MEIVTIQIHPGVFNADPSGSLAAKSVFHIENFIDDLSQLTYPIAIRRVFLWYQGASIPSGAYGDIGIALDPQRQYTIGASFPATENVLPSTLKPLGILEFFPNGSHQKDNWFPFPTNYREGDAIIMAPEVEGNFPVQLGINVSFESDGDINIGQPPNLVYNSPLMLPANCSQDICNRNVIPNVQIAGSKVRIHVSSVPALTGGYGNMNPTGAYVGIRDGQTSSMKSIPVPLTFGGLTNLSLGKQACMWSDIADLDIAIGDDLLVEIDHFNGDGNNNWSYTDGGQGSYYSHMFSGNTAAIQGTVQYISGRTKVIDAVQVLP